jgi:hypothetical protein
MRKLLIAENSEHSSVVGIERLQSTIKTHIPEVRNNFRYLL